MKIVIGAIIKRDGKLLLVEEDGVYKLPGGTVDKGESDLECLAREIDEELSHAKIKRSRYYRSFEGISPKKKESIELRTYFTELVSPNNAKESGEINSISWLSRKESKKYNLSKMTKRVLNSLSEAKYF